MNTKFVQAIACLSFFALILGISPISYATTTTTDSSYNTPIYRSELNFTATLNGDKVDMSWMPYAPAGFNYYKVIRSTTNENPVYPEDSYIKADGNPDASSYTDTSVPAGTVYYRVCSIVKPDRYCSTVIAISSDGTSSVVTNPVIAEPVKTTYIVIKSESEFTDAKTHLYTNSIEYLREKSIVCGYDDGTFKPDNPINRAEFMKIVMGAKFGSELSAGVDGYCFSDVVMDWYAPYVCLAKKKGIVGGYGDGTFKPASNINFAEAAKILSEVYGLSVESGGVWYEGYVKALQSDNYIPSTISQLNKSITRAEMSELIWRIKEQKKDQASVKLIQEPITVSSGDYAGWATYNGDGFSFNHPNWYQGVKWGWDLLTDEKDFIDNINVSNYMAVDSYISIYTVGGSDLNTSVWFAHPLVSSTELTINGVFALKRHYRAPRGTVVNGRTTGENENITVYTYLLNGKVAVLQYFNAYGSENYNVEKFYEIAESFVTN